MTLMVNIYSHKFLFAPYLVNAGRQKGHFKRADSPLGIDSDHEGGKNNI